MAQRAGFKGVNTPSCSSTSTLDMGQPKECAVRIQRNSKCKYSIMQFNRGDNVDLSKWKQARMERENNLREFKLFNPDMPTHGAGSEFGRERREEARRKKYGIVAKKYKEENQPWILKQVGAPGKKFKGKKEGLISENSNYYVFKQLPDGSFEATPIDATYSFTSVAKHKTLNAEEAEEEFGRRDRTFNFFTLMVKKRLKESTGEELSKEEEEEMKAKTSKSKKKADLRITEDDDYHDLMTSGESDAYSSDADDDNAGKSKKKGQNKSKKKKKKQDSDDEGEEESDEGDFEGKELDYISEDSSDEEAEQQNIDIKGLDEELQKIEDEEEDDEEDEEKDGGADKQKDERDGVKEETRKKEDNASSSSSSDSDDSDIDDNKIHSALLMQKKLSKRPSTPTNPKSSSKSTSRSSSRPNTPTPLQGTSVASNHAHTTQMLSAAAGSLQHDSVVGKRPGVDDGPSSKRQKLEESASAVSRAPAKEVVALTEDIVKRYLMRKPMTTKDLLYKLKSKKIGLKSDVIVKRVTEILRKLNPNQTKIKDKTYWFIKD